ncbi:MAG TPA: hypothetical protein VLA69_00895 [Gaiellaceae bacterium]|nr:hypothetical protein [Gaiellaceae bacterium]
MSELPTICPVCGSRTITFVLRDPDRSNPEPPRTSYGKWARCEQGHEWPVERDCDEEDST